MSESIDATLKICLGMSSGDLHTDTSPIFRYLDRSELRRWRHLSFPWLKTPYHGKTESNDIDASLEHFIGELTGQSSVAQHHRTDGMLITENLVAQKNELSERGGWGISTVKPSACISWRKYLVLSRTRAGRLGSFSIRSMALIALATMGLEKNKTTMSRWGVQFNLYERWKCIGEEIRPRALPQ